MTILSSKTWMIHIGYVFAGFRMCFYVYVDEYVALTFLIHRAD